jgi:hypothetical protein
MIDDENILLIRNISVLVMITDIHTTCSYMKEKDTERPNERT